MAETQLRTWWADVEHLREGYERRREVGDVPERSFERIRGRAEGRFARRQQELSGVVVAERPVVADAAEPMTIAAPDVGDLAPVDDLLEGWDARQPEGPIVREIVLERELSAAPVPEPESEHRSASRRPRREVPALPGADDRAPDGPRNVEVAEVRDGRRTVEIRGRTVASPTPRADPRLAPAVRRRPSGGAVEVFGQRPDRVALWALLLGIVLILVAIGSGDASAATF